MTLLFFLTVAFGSVILADGIFEISDFNENSDVKSYQKKNLTENTLVKRGTLSVLVPMGWSVTGVLNDGKYAEKIEMTPSSDLQNDKTVVGIQKRQIASNITLEQRYEKYKNDKTITTFKYIKNGNTRWLLRERTQFDDTLKIDMQRWDMYSIVNGKEYITVAGTPLSLLSKNRTLIEKILTSIKAH